MSTATSVEYRVVVLKTVPMHPYRSRSMRRLVLISLLALMAFSAVALAAPATPSPPRGGGYSGRSSEGHSVSFSVAGHPRAVHSFRIGQHMIFGSVAIDRDERGHSSFYFHDGTYLVTGNWSANGATVHGAVRGGIAQSYSATASGPGGGVTH
jgi:hypothetical protein